jgi:hypothetical protein
MTMAEFRDQKAEPTAIADLDDAELLGFECLAPGEEAGAEQAIGVAFNKRGLEEGPIIK